jgi:hypothetical protein
MALTPPQNAFINHLVLSEYEKGVMSEAEFARLVSIPPSTLTSWKKQPAFVASLVAAKHAYISSPDYLATVMNHRALLELEKEYRGSKKGDPETCG